MAVSAYAVSGSSYFFCANCSLARLRERAGVREVFLPAPLGGGWERGLFLFLPLLFVWVLRPVVDRQRPDFFCLAKRNRGKKRRALQAACPAELTTRLQRSVQTGCRKNEGLPRRLRRDACARGVMIAKYNF